MRIRTAVEAHRTAQDLETARHRFTALFENVPDPVAITDERGKLNTVNEAFADVFVPGSGAVEETTLDAVVQGPGNLLQDDVEDGADQPVTAETTRGPATSSSVDFRWNGPIPARSATCSQTSPDSVTPNAN